jgi:hypothetical protein
MSDGRIYEGHVAVFGQDTATEPSELPSAIAAKAVNRIFRGGKNRTRPPLWHQDLEFQDEAVQYERQFRYGNFQGWWPYRKKKPGREDGIVVSIAGILFFCVLVNEKWLIRLITKGNNAKLQHAWFWQMEEWLYVQDGESRPIFWNGLFPSTARRSDPAANEMPVGTIMVGAHGRIFLSNAFDQVAASDIIYGSGLTDSTGPQRFTENMYWAEGGYFGNPTELGQITGMSVIARQGQGLNGQGEVVILAEDGASAIEASIPRSQWKDARVHGLTLSGRGCVAPASVIQVNNDLFFRSDDGLSSYQILRAEQSREFSFGKLSQHVNEWMDHDTEWLKRYCSAIYFDNRVLVTVSPFLAKPDDLGHGTHRYHRGVLALDLDQKSDVQGDASFNWDGLWTGIRPCALLRMGKQAFAFSHDTDGENRIYEIKRRGLNDRIYGKASKTKWFYITKRFNWEQTGKSNRFEGKRFVGGDLLISNISDVVNVGVDYRPDNLACWSFAMQSREVGNDFEDDWKFSLTRSKPLFFETPYDGCIQGWDKPVNNGLAFQFMVHGEGDVQVDGLRVAIAPIPNPKALAPDCRPNNKKIELTCELEQDYSYNIIDSR